MKESTNFQKHYNHKGITPGFYSLHTGNNTLGDYLKERHKEDLRVMQEQGEVITYRLSEEELKEY